MSEEIEAPVVVTGEVMPGADHQPRIAGNLAGDPALSRISHVPLVPDHWHYLYGMPDGSVQVESERREQGGLPLLGRFYVRGETITLWEPAG